MLVATGQSMAHLDEPACPGWERRPREYITRAFSGGRANGDIGHSDIC